MRSLKFKAWDKKYKKWCSSEPFNLIGEWTVFDCLNQYIESDFIERLNDIEIVQCTGLKDRNGKEIYEGDIVKISPNWKFPEGEFIGKVIFDMEILGYIIDLGKCLHYHALYQFKDIEIIGNIYENKELLNV